ncbi:hypothetical protein Ae201684P_014901 [Aphanomyces euteiches]|nr:hypothetical protein Ae201684P_014901 [Aphanomyces euteiches]
MAKNISVPVRTVSQGCVSIVLALTDPFPLLHPSNVTSIDGAIVTLLVQATTISTASVNQVLATPTGYNISVAISNTANSVASMTLPPNGISTVNSYFYFDSNLDPWLIPLVPAMISSTQAQMAALPRTWLFSYNTRAAAPFGNDATGLLASLQTITSFPSTPISGTFLNLTFLQSLPWTPGALRTIIIVTSATSLAADTNVYTMEQGCWTANVMPYFLVPTPNLPMISQLISALGFGTAMGYNIQSFVTGPFQLLQAPPSSSIYLVTNPSNLIQMASLTFPSLTLSFRKSLTTDPVQTLAVANVLGYGVFQIFISTFMHSCINLPTAIIMPPYLGGWIPPFQTTFDLRAQWTALAGATQSNLTALSQVAQGFMIQATANSSYAQAFPVFLQSNTPIVIRGYIKFSTMINLPSIELVTQGSGSILRTSVPISTPTSSLDWQFLYSRVILTQTTTSLQIVVNASNLVQIANLGMYTEPLFACRCDPGYFVRNGNCERCPAGFACGGGIQTACMQQTYSFGAFASCQPCLTGWTCSGGLASPCPKGTFTNDAITCRPCPPGFKCLQGKQTLCSAGSFAPGNTSSCSLCLPGTFANASGASICLQCPAGYTSNYRRDHWSFSVHIMPKEYHCTGWFGYVLSLSHWFLDIIARFSIVPAVPTWINRSSMFIVDVGT